MNTATESRKNLKTSKALGAATQSVTAADTLSAARKRVYNPTSAAFVRDPYATYRVLREQQPLCYRKLTNAFVATRYEDIHAVLRDPRFGRDPAATFEAIHGEGINDEPVFANYNLIMLERNDPDHGRLRQLVNGFFNARSVMALKPAIARIADDLIDKMAPGGEVDLMRDFARALPVLVICDMLGIPDVDRQRFIDERTVSERIFQAIPLTREELDQENARFEKLRDYFLDLCEQRRAAPGDDLVSHLVAAHDNDGALSEAEMVAMLVLIFSAGHDTTVNLIGNALLALHQHPEQLDKLKAQPELMPTAIDELLRYDSSVQVSVRRALEPVELSGQRIEAGQLVLCALGAANRDPDIYPEPDRLDVARQGIKPLAFGGGIHFCLGAQLARIEGQIAIGTLLSRLPDLQLTELQAPNWAPNVFLRGLDSLPARIATRRPSHADGGEVADLTTLARPTGGCPMHAH